MKPIERRNGAARDAISKVGHICSMGMFSFSGKPPKEPNIQSGMVCTIILALCQEVIHSITTMHKDIYQAIEEYYRSHRDRFIWYFSQRINCDYSPRAEEMTQEVFVALLQAAQEEIPVDRLDAYAWGVARNKLKMLYRSKDWQTRKSPLYDSTHPVSYDEDALMELIDMHMGSR